MRKLQKNDFVKLKKSIDLGLPKNPEKGDIGKIVEKQGFMCFLDIKGRSKHPSNNGRWAIRSHDLELVCEECKKPFCYTLREDIQK